MTTNDGVPLMLGRSCEHTVAVMALAHRIGVELRHEYEAIGILDPWRAAPVVLVELEAAESVRRCQLPRRSAVILLAGDYSDDIWPTAEMLGASHIAVWPACEAWLSTRLAETHAEGAPEVTAKES